MFFAISNWCRKVSSNLSSSRSMTWLILFLLRAKFAQQLRKLNSYNSILIVFRLQYLINWQAIYPKSELKRGKMFRCAPEKKLSLNLFTKKIFFFFCCKNFLQNWLPFNHGTFYRAPKSYRLSSLMLLLLIFSRFASRLFFYFVPEKLLTILIFHAFVLAFMVHKTYCMVFTHDKDEWKRLTL